MQVSRKAKTVLKALEILEEVSGFDEGISNVALAACVRNLILPPSRQQTVCEATNDWNGPQRSSEHTMPNRTTFYLFSRADERTNRSVTNRPFPNLSSRPEEYSHRLLAARLDLHPSTTHRLLNTLVRKGYVGKNSALYRMGYKVLQLQHLTNQSAHLRHRARPLLTDLENRTGLTTNLAIRDGLKAVLIEIIKGSKNLVVNNNLGKPAPLHASSIGKCLLASLPEGEQDVLVKQLQLESYTPKTITDRHELVKELEITRERGYAIDNEEFVTGIRCIGAPIFNEEREVVAAISISGLASQIQGEAIEDLAKAVKNVSEEISSCLLSPA